jgi:hypothetical protein
VTSQSQKTARNQQTQRQVLKVLILITLIGLKKNPLSIPEPSHWIHNRPQSGRVPYLMDIPKRSMECNTKARLPTLSALFRTS